ncbi:PilZ domain-containing protein [Rhizobium halophytocola]|uniref:PilZ domain-containing protein n=1 Tax=Rhizobium halophytocola TaxID=735519 RepID=A0ABS4DVV5_9HYPH|nr:PilZ domain-containing protein [Rhizobium halophytocola]MBP1849824.1 hypothetical protein [Rhizobium halophytocola]
MQHQLDIKTRAAKRERCRLDVEVHYFNQQAAARVVDLSEHGLALDLAAPLPAAKGSSIRITNPELGVLEGTVQWSHRHRLGVKFKTSSNSSAQVNSYFRFFHAEIRPVLVR